MIKLKTTLLVCATLLGAISSYATEDNPPSKTNDPILLGRSKPGSPQKPRKPSSQHLWFSYDSASQQCEVTMNDGIECLNVVVEQLPVGFYYVGDVTPDNTTMSVEIPAGYYRITCTTDEGVTFVGEGDIN